MKDFIFYYSDDGDHFVMIINWDLVGNRERIFMMPIFLVVRSLWWLWVIISYPLLLTSTWPRWRRSVVNSYISCGDHSVGHDHWSSLWLFGNRENILMLQFFQYHGGHVDHFVILITADLVGNGEHIIADGVSLLVRTDSLCPYVRTLRRSMMMLSWGF